MMLVAPITRELLPNGVFLHEEHPRSQFGQDRQTSGLFLYICESTSANGMMIPSGGSGHVKTDVGTDSRQPGAMW